MTKGTVKRRAGSLSPVRKWSAYTICFTVYASGAIWLLFDYFVRVEDQFGFLNPHPQQGLWMMLHAAAALPLIWLFGMFWIAHIKASWRARASRVSGGTLWSVILWLGVTGYALYYVGSDFWRSILSYAHWVVGLAALIVFIIHVTARQRSS